MTVLTTHNLSKYYGAQDIFEGLTLSVNQGDRIALVGPNGEGKTTLLRLLAGLEPPTAGTMHTARGLKIRYLEQHPSLISSEHGLGADPGGHRVRQRGPSYKPWPPPWLLKLNGSPRDQPQYGERGSF
jgi:ABC-type branched-subunit amino acid transport system ATPase component